jgi:hypothetical protein
VTVMAPQWQLERRGVSVGDIFVQDGMDEMESSLAGCGGGLVSLIEVQCFLRNNRSSDGEVWGR